MAVAATSLTTLSNLKESLGISSSDTSKDSQLERIIDRATYYIESRTERKLKVREYNNGGSTHPDSSVSDEDYVYFSGSTKGKGGDTVGTEFYLPAWPVQPNDENVTFTLATLSNRGSDVVGGEAWDTDDLAEYDDYIVDRENGIIRLLGGIFSPGMRNYRVTMAAGYKFGSAQPYVPPDLEELCIEVAKKLFRDDAGLMSEKIGTWSRTYDPEKAKERIEEGIYRFRRFSL